MRLKPWNQVLITDYGVQSVSRLQCNHFLLPMQCHTLYQEVNDLEESIIVLFKKHVSIVSQQQAHPSSK